MIPLIIVGLILLAYSILLLFITAGWFRLSRFVPAVSEPKTQISIVVAARNEESVLPGLLGDLASQDYPNHLLEIIVVDDHSEDQTCKVVKEHMSSCPFRFRLIRMDDDEPGGKKAAIDRAIRTSEAELIITTDADCRVGAGWIRTIDAYYELHRPRMILAPVRFSSSKRLFGWLQELEFMSLQATTAGSAASGFPLMANGANLCYERNAWLSCGGFAGNLFQPSGDDVFMMLTFKKAFGPESVHFLPAEEAVVSTAPEQSFRAFIAQRLRWVSKSRGYTDIWLILSSLIVYMTNLAFAVSLLIGLFMPEVLRYAGIFFLTKLIIDLPVMISVSRFFKRSRLLLLFPFLEPLNAFYTAYIGLAGNRKSFSWKGRKFRPAAGNS